MSVTHTTSRRNFLKISSLTTGGLLIGFNWFDNEVKAAVVAAGDTSKETIAFNSYLSIDTDGTITVFSPNPELGQNIKTSFPMVVAEELEADWTKVKVEQAMLDTNKFDRQLTGGSGAVPHGPASRWSEAGFRGVRLRGRALSL